MKKGSHFCEPLWEIGVEPTTSFPKAFGTASAHKVSTEKRLALLRTFVESIGVEPTTSCMPCKRSSQLS